MLRSAVFALGMALSFAFTSNGAWADPSETIFSHRIQSLVLAESRQKVRALADADRKAAKMALLWVENALRDGHYDRVRTDQTRYFFVCNDARVGFILSVGGSKSCVLIEVNADRSMTFQAAKVFKIQGGLSLNLTPGSSSAIAHQTPTTEVHGISAISELPGWYAGLSSGAIYLEVDYVLKKIREPGMSHMDGRNGNGPLLNSVSANLVRIGTTSGSRPVSIDLSI